jgi:hypothetical protein
MRAIEAETFSGYRGAIRQSRLGGVIDIKGSARLVFVAREGRLKALRLDKRQ